MSGLILGSAAIFGVSKRLVLEHRRGSSSSYLSPAACSVESKLFSHITSRSSEAQRKTKLLLSSKAATPAFTETNWRTRKATLDQILERTIGVRWSIAQQTFSSGLS